MAGKENAVMKFEIDFVVVVLWTTVTDLPWVQDHRLLSHTPRWLPLTYLNLPELHVTLQKRVPPKLLAVFIGSNVQRSFGSF